MDFRLNKLTNFAIAVSIGHTSHTLIEEWLSKCFSNFALDSKTRLHFSQYTLSIFFREKSDTIKFSN